MNCCVSPTGIVAEAGETEIDLSVWAERLRAAPKERIKAIVIVIVSADEIADLCSSKRRMDELRHCGVASTEYRGANENLLCPRSSGLPDCAHTRVRNDLTVVQHVTYPHC